MGVMPMAVWARPIMSRAATASSATWSGVQKMWASLRWMERTRVSPPSTPESSERYMPPISAMRRGRSRWLRGRERKMRAWWGHRLGRRTTCSEPTSMGGNMSSP
ncbi:hypothetical protein BJF83_18290 [Nocardiopsis sp. CNR-923]|nr:hypothetical protein BJF83_18290 [Nocardiopsis sp. CNR-923]